MQCVGRRLLWCPVTWILCDRGAALVTAGDTHRLPALRGSNQRAAAPPLCSDLPGTHAERSPRPLVLSPFGFCGSRRQWVVNPRTRVSGALAVEDNRPSRRLELREPETTAGQPAPVSTKAPGTRDHCRATGPRVYKSSSTWSHRGQPALVTTTGLSARDHKRATGPRVYKSSSTGPSGDNQSRRNPDLHVLINKK